MTATIFLLLLTIASAGPTVAQETPRVQVFGGYSYVRYDTQSFGFSRQSGLNGYTLSPAFNFVRGFGVVAELSGQYGKSVNLRDVAVGPQFFYSKGKMMFVGHFLIGDARSLVHSGGPQEDTARAVAVGGGVDFALSPRFAVRAVEVDYLHSTLFNATQNNLRFSTGLVYRWGSIKKTHRTLAPNPLAIRGEG